MRRLATIILLLAAAGCGGDKSTAPKRLEGTYTLRTLDSQVLPVTVVDDPSQNFKGEIIGGSITLSAGGTFSAPWSFRTTDNGVVETFGETCTGTFTRSGNHLVLQETDDGSFCGGQFDGDWDGSDGFTEGTAVYRR